MIKINTHTWYHSSVNFNLISSFYRNAIFEDYIYDSLLDENMDDFDEDAYLERLARMKP